MAAKATDNFAVLLGLETCGSNLSLSDKGGFGSWQRMIGYVTDYRL